MNNRAWRRIPLYRLNWTRGNAYVQQIPNGLLHVASAKVIRCPVSDLPLLMRQPTMSIFVWWLTHGYARYPLAAMLQFIAFYLFHLRSGSSFQEKCSVIYLYIYYLSPTAELSRLTAMPSGSEELGGSVLQKEKRSRLAERKTLTISTE